MKSSGNRPVSKPKTCQVVYESGTFERTRQTVPGRLTIRLTPALLHRLDEFAVARGASRAEAARTAILEAVMTPEERQGIPDRTELLALLSAKARTVGSVPAMKLLLEEMRCDHGDQPKPRQSAIDQLAKRRSNSRIRGLS